MTDIYFKWTRKGRVPSYQRGAQIPYRRWTERVTNPVLCERGWHACRRQDVLAHISDNLAKRICATCPIRQACLDYAINNFENLGVWGGKTPRERRNIRNQQRRGAA